MRAASSEVVYTYTHVKNGNNTDYTKNYDVTVNDIKWSVPGNQSNDDQLRIGGKSLDKVDRLMYTKDAISKAVGKLTINHYGVTSDKLVLNSVTLTVASDADFQNVIESVTKSELTIGKNTNGSIDFEPTENSWPANSYYKFAFNISNSQSSNYAFQLSSIVFYGAADGSDTRTETTVTFADGYATSGAVGDVLDLPVVTISAGGTPIDAVPTWESDNEGVANIANGKLNLMTKGTAKITASFAGDKDLKPSSKSYTVIVCDKYTTIAAILENITSTKTDMVFEFTNLLVTYVKNNYTYVSDGTDAIQFYGSESGLKAGDKITGSISGKVYTYNNLPEITDYKLTVTAKTEGNEVTFTPIAPDALANNINKPIIIDNAVYVSVDNNNYNFIVGETSFVVRNTWGIDLSALTVDKAYKLTGMGSVFKTTNQLNLISFEDATAEPAGFRDIKLDLTAHPEVLTEAPVYITVAEDGTIGTTEDASKAAATIIGKVHSYGSSNFTASVPVQGCVKITYATHDYGNDIVVTNSEGTEVAKFNTQGAKWMSNHDNVVVAYYRTNAPTTLHFSNASYNPYFAVEAIDEADLPPLVETATLTFALGNQAAEGVVPNPITVVKGETVHFPANYTLYVEGKTMKYWMDADGNALQDGALNADMTVYPYFEANTANLADRTEPVTVTYNLSGYNDYPKYKFEGNNGIMVTQATVNGESIDVKVDVNATSGKFSHNGNGWHQVNAGTKVTVPSCKGAVVSVGTYNDATGTSMTFAGNSGTSENNVVSYTATANDATCEIAQVSNNYWNNLTVTLPVVEQGGDDPTETGVLYSWESPKGTPIETGGVAKSYNGDTETTNDPDNSDINAGNSDYHVLRLRGNATFTTNFITITLDNALKAGDKINITAYRNKDAADKKSGALIKFEKGSEQVRTDTSDKPGLEFVNIDTSDASAADQNRGTEPNTIQLTVPESAAGSTTLSLTRAQTGTNLFITKLVIETEGGDEPVAQDVTATWDFEHNCANLAPKSEGGTYTETTMASDVEGISMNIVYNNGQIKNNDNSYQVTTGVEMQIPVKNAGDVVTVVGYPDSNYSHYSVAGTEATEPTTEYTAKTADAEQGYVSVVSTSGNNYYLSISVLQKAQSSGPTLVEKSIYKTDFSEWEELTASLEESNVAKKTKFTNENLNFTFFNTGVNTGDYDESRFPNNNGYRIYCPKKKDNNPSSYVTTSALANITKVRFIHGATGSSRGYKLEAKGDGDEDWVVVSDSYASPNGWCEVTKTINKTNCQLRFTNLAESQYAYIFELEIFGNVDLSGAPLLETMTANGKTYNADDIFEMANSGNYEATIELASSETMPSADNPVTATAANGEIGTITYATEEGNTIVTIPVTADNNTANYVATFTRKPMLTLTYIGVDGTTELGTQQVEKDAPIGEFAVDIENVSSLRNGYKARGWFKQNYVGEKYTTASTFSENANLYAVETEIEVASESRKYDFNLTDKFFYAEDHEAFNPSGNGFYWHDATHGWAFKNGNKIDLLVGSKAVISVARCQYGADGSKIYVKNAAGETLDTQDAKADACGSLMTYTHEGEPGTLTLEFETTGETYIHSVKIANVAETNYEKDGDWFFVKAGDVSSLIDALEIANGTAGDDRVFIFLPNGTYDLGTAVQTAISRNNLSLIGESMEGVIIKNAPPTSKEGLMSASTIHNTGNNLYMQDLTLQNDLDYYGAGAAGRANAFHDGGDKTIAKNVKLMSYQDTYLTPANKQTYWETSEIHGAVDFICGGGDIFFEKCKLVTESRKKGEKSGEATIVAPQPQTAEKFGYVFNNCTIENQAATFNFGRAWGGASGATVGPMAAYLNTTLNQPNEIRNTRFTTAGMNEAADKFKEYNSMDKDGNVVSPASNVLKFTHSTGDKEYETILTAEEAAGYALDKVFTDWTPANYTVQVEAPAAELKDGTISWTPANNGAIAYAIFKNGALLGITTGTSYVIDAVAETGEAAPRRAEVADKYTIRAANPRGGFGEAKEVKDAATGISTVKNGQQTDTIYNMQGVRVNNAQKGVYIINGKKVVIK